MSTGTKINNKFHVLLTFLLIALALSSGFTQSARPKIGLVLSGGGAKGIAHIRILQVLDSLGIVPDYIAGTSMGSVVGGLYATGYTASQIDSITRSVEWDKMFSNSVSFDEINIEEKDEFGKYIYELPLKGFKPQLPMGLVEGQHIEELLAELFFPANSVTDFNKLPTPFLCVAADIVKGEPVILNKGSLAASVRASMSIPTVFPPVRIGDRLLVDGGVYMNLPVTYCRQMGADFIIAVDVGGGLYKEEELTSAATLLIQTTFLAGNMSYEKEKRESDIFVDVVRHLKYGTMDFEYGPSMMQSGNVAVKEVLPQLVELAGRMKPWPKRKIAHVSQMTQSYKLETIQLEGISKANAELVTKKFRWKKGDKVNSDQVASSVHKLMGTRLFNKISYTIEGDSTQSVLKIKANERPLNATKFGIHYDTDRGAGLILNFTARNLFVKASRMVTTLDLAENPRGRVNYFYYLGKQSRWWHHSEFYGERVILNSFIGGTPVPDVVSVHFSASTNFNRTLSQNSMLGMGASWHWNEIEPKVDPRTELTHDPVEIIEYKFQTLSGRFFYQTNTFDKVFYPTRGRWIRAEINYNFINPFDAHLLLDTTVVATEYLIEGNVQNYARLYLKAQKNFDLSEKITLQLIGQAGLTQEMFATSEKYSAYFYGAGDFISAGGQLFRPRATTHTFIGLREGELSVPQFMMAGAQIQYNPIKNIYLIPAANILAAGYNATDFWSTLSDFNFAGKAINKAFYHFGYGVTSSYMSPLGPIQFTLSKDSQVDKLRAFFSIGFTL